MRTAEIMRRAAASFEAAGVIDARAPATVGKLSENGPIRVRAGLGFDGAFLDALAKTHAVCRAEGRPGVAIEIARPEGEDETFAPVLEALETRFADATHAPDVEPVDTPPPRWSAALAVTARGRGAEARRAAFEVARALDEGASLDRIGIAVPDGDDAFLEALRFELREADVPWSEPWGPSALHEPEARAVFRLLDMADTRIGREALLELLLTPGLHAGSWFREADEAKANGLARELAEALRAVPLSFDADGALFAASLRETPRLRDAVARIGADVIGLRNVDTRAAFAASLDALVDRLQLGEPSARELSHALGEKQAELRPLGLRALGDGARAVRSILLRAEEMANAARTFGEPGPVLLVDLATELEAAVRAAPSAPRGASARAAAVRIGPPREMVGVSLDLLVVTRLTSVAYAGDDAPDPWMEASTLGRRPPRLRPPRAIDDTRIRSAELTSALGSAKEVVLLRSSLDGDGRETEGPHPIFVRALGANARTATEPASRVASSAVVSSERRRGLVRLATGGAPPPDLVARRAIEAERALFFADPARPSGPFSGRIVDRTEKLETRLGTRGRPVAVTVVDTAAACPFRAFAERVLGAKKTEDAEEAGAPRDRGVLVHRALRIAFDAWRALPPSLSDGEVLAAVHRELDAKERLDTASPLRREAASAAIEDVLGVVKLELERRPGLRYALGEQEFGSNARGALPSLDLVASDGRRVRLRGAIDRVDLSSDRSTALVIDYKTGKAPSLSSVGVTSFQLPLYALAVRRALDVARVGAAYVAVRQAGTVELSPKGELGRVFEDVELGELARRAADLVSRVASGNVEPRPKTRDQCQRCNARDVCRRPVVAPESEGEPEPA